MKASVEYDKLAGKEYTRESVTAHEGAFLARLAGLVEAEIFVEIGSWIGVSTIYLAQVLKERGEGVVYAIDPHCGTVLHKRKNPVDTESLLRENLKRFEVESFTRVVRKTSLDALMTWGSAIDLLFLDGAHWFKNVREDFFGWSPWVHTEGIVAFHDYPTRVGVRRVVDEIVRPSGLWDELGHEQRLIAFRRRRE